MTEAGSIHVKLVGGPDDGACYLLSPAGATGFPGRVQFFGASGLSPGWHTYEVADHGQTVCFPSAGEVKAIDFHFIGFEAL